MPFCGPGCWDVLAARRLAVAAATAPLAADVTAVTKAAVQPRRGSARVMVEAGLQW